MPSLLIAACDVDAVGVEECRAIEKERCRAARHCDLGIDSDDEVEKCERALEDYCLHGLEIDEAPRSQVVRRCVNAIRRAGECADDESADTPATECNVDVGRSRTTACDVVQAPEEATDCEFLIAEPEEAEDEPDADTPKDSGTD